MNDYLRSLQTAVAVSCLPVLVYGSGVITEPTETHLRAALAGGGTVTFASDGVIPLASTLVITNDTSLDASGRSITLSGNDAVRVLQVQADVHFDLIGLAVANGRAEHGAGLFNAGGTVRLMNCAFAFNQARGTNGVSIGYPPDLPLLDGGPSYGGAVWNSGVFVAIDTVFRTNSATGGTGADYSYPEDGDGGVAAGGTIYNTGSVMLTNCTFLSNQAVGGGVAPGIFSGDGGEAKGGAIMNAGGSVAARDCAFLANAASGGLHDVGNRNGNRGNAFGGGICNTGTLHLVSTTFSTNSAVGPNVSGGGVYHAAGALTVVASQFRGNVASGNNGPYDYYAKAGGFARGGAVFNGGSAQFADTTLSSNGVSGVVTGSRLYGEGPGGSEGSGGCFFNRGTLHLVRSTLVGNRAQGGVGSAIYEAVAGGSAYGGACSSLTGEVSLVNCTVTANQAVGAPATTCLNCSIPGSSGDGAGGAIFATNTVLRITNSTIAANWAVAGDPGVVEGTTNTGPSGQALTGGVRHAGGGSFSLYNSVVAQNTAGDVYGSFTGAPNLIGGDPRLGPLADNGGPTWTLALLPDSPAIHAAVNLPGVSTDQRGVPRPFGAAPDLGAYEWNGTNFYTDFHLDPLELVQGGWRIRGVAPPGRAFRLSVSSNLSDWVDLSTNTTDERGRFDLPDAPLPDWSIRYYRTVSP